MANTSLAEIQKKYKDSGAHLLLPVSTDVQINPFYKYTIMEVTADTKDNSGDIFKVGSVNTGKKGADNKDIWADTYSPAKPLLMKLASAAGIQFDPNNTYGEFVTKNCYRAKAFGAMRMPDGTGKTHADEKVINLEDEEDRLRLEFMDKSIQGITEYKAANEAEKLFKGERFDTTDKSGKSVKAFKIADCDRQKYIDRAVLVNMTLLRKTFAEKAMTGAILRVVRALIGLKGTYTKEELQKPFVIPRVTFSPDYNDPTVRAAMLEQGMNSMSNMFGGVKALQQSSKIEGHIADVFEPSESEFAAFNSDTGEVIEDDPQDEPENKPEEPKSEFECSKCNKAISKAVSDFSMRKYKKLLCVDCQKVEGK